MYHTPACASKRKEWIDRLNLDEASLKAHHRICSSHFPNGNQTQMPSLALSAKFASPKKKSTERCERALKRKALFVVPKPKRHVKSKTTTPSGSDERECHSCSNTPLCAHVGEQLLNSSDYSVHELPDLESDTSLSTIEKNETEVVVSKARVSRIELLESQNDQLQSDFKKQGPKFFRIENFSKDDSSVKFYTGFISYEVLFAFFQFLGPAVNSLKYWGTKIKTKRRKMMLHPINQFFLTLVKLRLNLRERDLALRFGISLASVSKYFITWVCFLYHHFKEITWMPSVEQVRATLPYAF